MKKKKRLVRAAALLLAALCCVGALGPWAVAAPRETQVVRIPCGINDMLYLDDMGRLSGRYAAYLAKLQQVNGWAYECVETTWPQAVEMLERGELDLLFPTNYTDERAQTMDFSTLVAGYIAPGLFARVDSGYGYEDFAGFDGARIAVTKGSSNEQALIAFAQSRGFTYQPVYMDSNTDKPLALARGEVDMIVMSANSDLEDAALVSVMEASPFYFTVKKGNDDLLAQVDEGMQELIKEHPELMAETFRQCLVGENGNMLAFTQEEKDFIQSGQPVVVGFYEGTKPLAYVDEDGHCDGIYVELLEYVKEHAGVNLEFKPISRSYNWQDMVKSGELDFFIGASSTLATDDSSFRSTNTFFPYDNVLITRRDCAFNELEAPVIALTNGRLYLNSYVSETLRAGEIRYYHSAKDCFVAVLKGEADGTVLNNVEYNYQSKNDRFAELIQ